MKKCVRIFSCVAFLFIVFRFFFFFLYRGRVVNYDLKMENGSYHVNEEYIRNKENISNHYYIEVEVNETLFDFFVADSFDKKSYIVDKIYSFQNEQYSCILPIFVDSSIQTDILCKSDDIIYPYLELKNKSLELDKFATSMEEYGYLKRGKDETIISHGLNIIKNNLDFSHTIVIPSYRGVLFINKQDKNVVSSVDLFKDDIYIQSIQALTSNYYVVADYDSSYSFHAFKIVDLRTNRVSAIYSDNAISMDSYVQGVIDECIYIIDRSNRKQYKIDVLNKSVILIGNSKKGVQYYNGNNFETISIYDTLDSDMLFGLQSIKSSKYDYVYVYDGIYYSYLKNDNGYDVFISYADDSSLYTYGFSISSMDRVKYGSGFVYYMEGDTIYRYNFKDGVVPIIKYSEFLYNSKLDFFVYEK